MKIKMEEQAKQNTRLDVELRAMEIHTHKDYGIFTVYRVYNGWIYMHNTLGLNTFVPEYYNVNADCRVGN
jgi:hypothetical protein